MKALAVAVLTAAALAGAEPAQAGWKLDRAALIAQKVWNVCPAGLAIRYATPGATWDHASGWAWEGVCVVYLNDWSSVLKEFEPLCTTVLHEAGHIAGYRDPWFGHYHSSDPSSVMRANLDMIDFAGTVRGVTTRKWIGGDRRCRERGRPYLERHGLLEPK